MIFVIFIVLSLAIAYTFFYLHYQIWCLRIDNETLNNKFLAVNSLNDKSLEKAQKAFDKVYDVEAKVNSINNELAIKKKRIDDLEFNHRKFNDFLNNHVLEKMEILETSFLEDKELLEGIEKKLNNSLFNDDQFKGLVEKLEEMDATIEILKNSFQQIVPTVSRDIFSNVFIEINKLEETLRSHQEKLLKENGLEALHTKS